MVTNLGAAVTFSVTATGTPPPYYQWWRNGAPIAGATQSSYTASNLQLADSGSQFSCALSNVAGNATSASAV